MKTAIEIREKTNHPVFVLGWPIGSFPEVSVWIAAGSSTPASRPGVHPSRGDLSLENPLVPR
jgi:hypothetical protein